MEICHKRHGVLLSPGSPCLLVHVMGNRSGLVNAVNQIEHAFTDKSAASIQSALLSVRLLEGTDWTFRRLRNTESLQGLEFSQDAKVCLLIRKEVNGHMHQEVSTADLHGTGTGTGMEMELAMELELELCSQGMRLHAVLMLGSCAEQDCAVGPGDDADSLAPFQARRRNGPQGSAITDYSTTAACSTAACSFLGTGL